MLSFLEKLKQHRQFSHERWWRPLYLHVYPTLIRVYFQDLHGCFEKNEGRDLFDELLLRFILLCDAVFADEYFRCPHRSIYFTALVIVAIVIKYTSEFPNVQRVYSVLTQSNFPDYYARDLVYELEAYVLHVVDWRLFANKDAGLRELFVALREDRRLNARRAREDTRAVTQQEDRRLLSTARAERPPLPARADPAAATQ